MQNAPKTCRKCGGTVHGSVCLLCEMFASGAVPDGHRPSCWPQVMESVAVHPKQAAEATERNRRHGVNVTYDGAGRAVVPDRGERKRLLKLEGFHDRSGGYGD